MQSTRGVKRKARKAQSRNPRQTRVQLVIILGLTVLYIVTFQPLTARVGAVGSALIAIPVAAAGWCFGISAGLAAGFLGIILSASLLTLFEGNLWITWLANYWPGNLMVIAIGVIAGILGEGSTERRQIEVELQSRERFLALINITTKNILNPKNPDDIYYYLATHIVNLFVADYAYLVRWDATRERAVLLATTKSLGQHISSTVLGPSEAAIIESVMRTRRVLVINDVPKSHYIVNPARFEDFSPPTRSAICIPLISGDYKFGAVTVAFDTPRRFTREELDHAELAGNQIALALWTVQQEHQIKLRLKEANALADIGRALSETERVGIETVLQQIVDSAMELIPGAEHAVLHLLDDEQQVLIPRAVAGSANKPKSMLNMHPGEGVAGQVIATREVIAIPDVQADPRFLFQAETEEFRSLIVAPIQSNERCVGTISIQSHQPNAFTPDESHLLVALGTQAAIAIGNANLLETTQQDLREIDALYRISRGLAGSLDPDELMKDVAGLLQLNFGYYHVQIFIVDPTSGDLVARQGSGKVAAQLQKQGRRLPAGAGIVGHVAETGKPFVTNNVDDVIFFIGDPLLPDTRSELAVPIKVEGQVVGVLDIQQSFPTHLSSRQMQLMGAVADQLAVALQKANLYTRLQSSLHQAKTIRAQWIQSERLAMAGRLLASVSHELNNPIQAIQNALFLLKEGEKLSEQGRQDLEIVLSETERMAAMINRLRATYRPTRTEKFQDIQLNNIIEDVHALLATHMRHNNIRFEFCPDSELPAVSGIPEQLRQVMLNLFMNAIEAMPTGGRLVVKTERLPKQKKVLLTVTDTGCGIDSQLLPHIFEPFVTGKETGTGLGLAITHDIISQHHGDIRAENNPQGATFKVWFPIRRRRRK